MKVLVSHCPTLHTSADAAQTSRKSADATAETIHLSFSAVKQIYSHPFCEL